jgi:diadenosine tetraphosphate (Ap4A) HIT family hydrolase
MNLRLFERAAALRAMLGLNLFQEQHHAPNSNSNNDFVDSGSIPYVPTAADDLPAQQLPHHQQMRRMHISTSSSAKPTLPPTTLSASINIKSSNDYQDNDTVFGDILRGTRPARILGETKHVLAFQDLHPKARFHALIIPKTRFIPSVFDLQQQAFQQDQKYDSDNDVNDDDKSGEKFTDLMLLQEMENMAISLLEKYEPQTFLSASTKNGNKNDNNNNDDENDNDYILCFHVPPFNSVDHLHLHVLAPASQMSWFHRYVKYNVQSTRWCTSLASVKRRLAAGQPAVPCYRP